MPDSPDRAHTRAVEITKDLFDSLSGEQHRTLIHAIAQAIRESPVRVKGLPWVDLVAQTSVGRFEIHDAAPVIQWTIDGYHGGHSHSIEDAREACQSHFSNLVKGCCE